MIFDEVITDDPRYTYRFYLIQPMGIRAGAARGTYVSGSVREKGDDFIKIRRRNLPDETEDVIIPLHSIHYIEQNWARE